MDKDKLTIRFGVWKYESKTKRKTIAKTGTVVVDVTEEQYLNNWNEAHTVIMKGIRSQYDTTWHVHGYVPDFLIPRTIDNGNTGVDSSTLN